MVRQRAKDGNENASSPGAGSEKGSNDDDRVFAEGFTNDQVCTLLASAVTFDEMFQDEDILQCPLETARLYQPTKRGRSHDEFAITGRLIRSLLQHNGKHSMSPSNNPTLTAHLRKRRKDRAALTPIILSGVISMMDPSGDGSSMNADSPRSSLNSRSSSPGTSNHSNKREDDEPLLTAEELVLFTQGLRQRSLQRVRARHRRRYCQAVLIPFAVVSLLMFCLLLRTVREIAFIEELGYMLPDPSIDPAGIYSVLCLQLDASVWDQFYGTASSFAGESLLRLPTGSMEETAKNNDCPAVEGGVCPAIESPTNATSVWPKPQYAMHSHLFNNTVPLQTVIVDILQKQDKHINLQSGPAPPPSTPESLVNQLVRKSMLSYGLKQDIEEHNILDLGCGVGGTLYSLVPLTNPANSLQTLQKNRKAKKRKENDHGVTPLSYTGVSLTAVEHLHAQLFSRKKKAELGDHVTSSFYMQNFDDDSFAPWGLSKRKFTSVLAIESLSYSHNVPQLLRQVHKSMDKFGILIMVDDVVLSSTWLSETGKNVIRIEHLGALTQRPTLQSHEKWTKTLANNGFQVLHVRDLDLEFGVDLSEKRHAWENEKTIVRQFWRHMFDLGFFLVFDFSEFWWVKLLDYSLDRYPESVNSVIPWVRFLRLLQLRRAVRGYRDAMAMRREAFSQGALGYNMYICRRMG